MDLKALFKLTYGLYVVSSRMGERLNGQIANTAFQTTAEPPIIAVSINKANLTHKFILESNVFSVSILSRETPMRLIGMFGFRSGRELDKFEDTSYRIGKTGAPIVLDHSIAVLEVEVIGSVDVGTHTIFVGNVVDAETIGGGEPMTYAYYQEIKRGRTPAAAPTYAAEDTLDKARASGQMRCTICGYVYDPEVGDPDSGIEPGTPFEKLPDDWVCPVCGAGKEAFERRD